MYEALKDYLFVFHLVGTRSFFVSIVGAFIDKYGFANPASCLNAFMRIFAAFMY